MGNQAPVMQALADTPSGYVPDASFRDWSDESKQALREEEEKKVCLLKLWLTVIAFFEMISTFSFYLL